MVEEAAQARVQAAAAEAEPDATSDSNSDGTQIGTQGDGQKKLKKADAKGAASSSDAVPEVAAAAGGRPKRARVATQK